MLVAAGLHVVHQVGHRVAAGHILERLHGPAVEGSGKVGATAVGGRGDAPGAAGGTRRLSGRGSAAAAVVIKALLSQRLSLLQRVELVLQLLAISLLIRTQSG